MKKFFLDDGEKAITKKFDYIAPIGDEEEKAVIEVLRGKTLSGFYKDFLGGKKVKEFEEAFAKYIGTKYSVAVNSGTSALHVALAACDIGPGDEVIVPALTFTATATSVLMNNAIPIFVDIDENTLNIDPKKIEEAITEKTKAILLVHLYGKVAKLNEIKEIAKEKNIFVIEDSCQSPGCEHEGKKTGSIGDLGVFSFVETKNLVIGEGGMITTNNLHLAEKCRLIRNHGEVWVKDKPRQYLTNILGYNFRMTEIEAAIGIEQLKKLDFLNEIRVKNAKFLFENLNIDGLTPIEYKSGEVCHIFPILFDEEKIGISRDRFLKIANSEGIPISTGYPHPLYKNPIFQEKIVYGKEGCPYSCQSYNKEINYKEVRCKVSEDACKKLICIKHVFYPYTPKDMNEIVDGIKKICENIKNE